MAVGPPRGSCMGIVVPAQSTNSFSAGLVLLPQHHILFPPPPPVQLAEATVLVAVRVCLPVLLPQQLLRQMSMLLSLTVKVGEVGHGQHRRAAARRSAEQRGLKSVIVPLRTKRPGNLGSFGSLQILVCGASSFGRLLATPGPLQTSIEELL